MYLQLSICPCICGPMHADTAGNYSTYKGITEITWGRGVISRPEIMDGQPSTFPQSKAIRLLRCIGAINGICCLAASCPSETPPNHTAYIYTQIHAQLSLAHACLHSQLLPSEFTIYSQAGNFNPKIINNLITNFMLCCCFFFFFHITYF